MKATNDLIKIFQAIKSLGDKEAGKKVAILNGKSRELYCTSLDISQESGVPHEVVISYYSALNSGIKGYYPRWFMFQKDNKEEFKGCSIGESGCSIEESVGRAKLILHYLDLKKEFIVGFILLL